MVSIKKKRSASPSNYMMISVADPTTAYQVNDACRNDEAACGSGWRGNANDMRTAAIS